MKILIQFALSFAILLSAIHPASADPVPPEMQANYTGPGQSGSTDPRAPKEKSRIILSLTGETSATFSTTDAQGNVLSSIPGTTLYLPEYSSLLVRFDINSGVFLAGSLQVKGKPGKVSLTGRIDTFQGGFGGLNFSKVKLRQAPAR